MSVKPSEKASVPGPEVAMQGQVMRSARRQSPGHVWPWCHWYNGAEKNSHINYVTFLETHGGNLGSYILKNHKSSYTRLGHI